MTLFTCRSHTVKEVANLLFFCQGFLKLNLSTNRAQDTRCPASVPCFSFDLTTKASYKAEESFAVSRSATGGPMRSIPPRGSKRVGPSLKGCQIVAGGRSVGADHRTTNENDFPPEKGGRKTVAPLQGAGELLASFRWSALRSDHRLLSDSLSG